MSVVNVVDVKSYVTQQVHHLKGNLFLFKDGRDSTSLYIKMAVPLSFHMDTAKKNAMHCNCTSTHTHSSGLSHGGARVSGHTFN